MNADSPQPIDLLITHGVVITIDAQRRIFSDGAVAVQGKRIVEVGHSAELEQKYAARRSIDARGGVVQPGFVDCHVHLSQHLGRGTIPDLWPEEKEHDQWLPLLDPHEPGGRQLFGHAGLHGDGAQRHHHLLR